MEIPSFVGTSECDLSSSNPESSIGSGESPFQVRQVFTQDLNALPSRPSPVIRDGTRMGVTITPPVTHGPVVKQLIDQTNRTSAAISPPGTPIPPRNWTHQFPPPQMAKPAEGGAQVPLEHHEKVLQRLQELESWQKRVKRNVKFLLDEVEDL